MNALPKTAKLFSEIEEKMQHLTEALDRSKIEVVHDTTPRPKDQGGAGILPYCPATGRYLLNLRSSIVNEPNVWNCWGGGVDPGETFKVAARRELKEEAGYSGQMEIKPLYKTRAKVGVVQEAAERRAEIYKNPSHREFANIVKSIYPRSRVQNVRALIYPKNGDVYMWGANADGIYETHNVMSRSMGMLGELAPAYLYTENGKGVFWQYATWSGSSAKDKILMENPKGMMLRYLPTVNESFDASYHSIGHGGDGEIEDAWVMIKDNLHTAKALYRRGGGFKKFVDAEGGPTSPSQPGYTAKLDDLLHEFSSFMSGVQATGRIDHETKKISVVPQQVLSKEYVRRLLDMDYPDYKIKWFETHLLKESKAPYEFQIYLGIVPEEFDPALNDESDGYKWATWDEMATTNPKHWGLELMIEEMNRETVEEAVNHPDSEPAWVGELKAAYPKFSEAKCDWPGCYDISKEIGSWLRSRGVKSKLMQGWFDGNEDLYHWWLDVDGWIVDGSAEQFRSIIGEVENPRIVPPTAPEQREYSRVVTESLDTETELQWGTDKHGSATATFTTPNREHPTTVTFYDGGGGWAEVSFSNAGLGSGDEYTPDGRGDPREVFSGVRRAIDTYISRHPNIEGIYFSSSKGNRKRERVYGRMARRLAESMGWELEIDDSDAKHGFLFFRLSPPD